MINIQNNSYLYEIINIQGFYLLKSIIIDGICCDLRTGFNYIKYKHMGRDNMICKTKTWQVKYKYSNE
jgi:hypothetical protein